ncbi:MotE family protein [Methylobacterium platani]|uniref:MgtE protein n=2 Tax=Methylobacterium platani TaxID=427683 RepID=A0A179S7N4_9HYPH|nr:MotE family protein [Methylobacterium platani]KMO10965.1 MgtE protein [Methylobacterium platani JCM 14648]OAS20935.1 MgtE protein [Methylobacterium platani]
MTRTLLTLLLLGLAAPALAAGDGHGGAASDPAKDAAMRAIAARDAPKEPTAQEFVAARDSGRDSGKTGYCATIADAAADARYAWQKEQLAALEKQVEERIRRLEEKRAEYEAVVQRRKEFLAKAEDGVVAVYAKMRADAAALQLSNMPEDAAAAILVKLNARTASAVLAEMEASRAAALARKMAEAGRRKDNERS